MRLSQRILCYTQDESEIEASMEPSCAQGTIAMGKLCASTKFSHQAPVSDMACFRPASSEGRLLATIDEIGGVMLANVPVSRLPHLCLEFMKVKTKYSSEGRFYM
jgi:hypothetical protein